MNTVTGTLNVTSATATENTVSGTMNVNAGATATDNTVAVDGTLNATDGGAIYCDNVLFVNDKENNPLDFGVEKTFTAVADYGYTFAYWANEDGDVVTLEALKEKGIVPKKETAVKILARGTLDKALTVEADAYSLDAIKMIVLVGGTAIKK